MERTTGILLLCLALTPAGSAAGSPSKIVSSDETACVAATRLAVIDAVPVGRDRDCWRVGPVTLGMSEADVERRLGTPVAVNDALSSAPNSSHRYRAMLYAFPARGAGLVVAGQADLRLAELRYERGRLAAIDNAPGARIDGYECASRARRRPASETISVSALAGPMLRFSGVGVGEPLSVLQHRFGRTPTSNASKDWYSYLPVPISFDVDPDRDKVVGFAVAADDEALTTAALPELHLQRDPATCELESIRFGLGAPISVKPIRSYR